LNGCQSREHSYRYPLINIIGIHSKPIAAVFARLRAKQSEGFILVSVLLLCVMLVSSATAYAWFARIQMKSAFQERFTLQARGIAFLLTKEVIKGLKLDTNTYDSPLEPWFQPMLIPLNDFGIASVVLKPLDNKIPLQNLFVGTSQTFRGELKEVWLKMWAELGERGTLPAKVVDYIDEDTVPTRDFIGGSDGPDNLNRNLYDISELLGLKEITTELLYGDPPKLGLAEYCTLWSGAKMNINVVEPRVIALFPNMNRNIVEEIVKFREKKEITSLDDLREIPSFPYPPHPYFQSSMGCTSTYFNLIVELMDENGNSSRYFDIVFLKSDGRILKWEEK
jgi:type II secretory pathway component PulK